jgi:predicted transcriptional regulator
MVAVLSLEWMNTSQVQMAMRRLWALKNNTTRDILEELESEGAIIQERDDKTQIFKWGATREGVKFWILGTENIPAGVVQVVSTTSFVAKLEVGTSP